MSRTIGAVCVALATGLFACGNPVSRMQGTYKHAARAEALEVTSNKMIVSSGPVSITADYRVLAVHENVVTVFVSVPQMETDTIVVQVGDDGALTFHEGMFAGSWLRR